MLFWWASRTATNSVAHALHTFGGYGLTNEYDIQLYHRRAKAWPLVLGDPQEELVRAGRRLLLGETARRAGPGPSRGRLRSARGRRGAGRRDPRRVRRHPRPREAQAARPLLQSHDWEVHRALGKARLLFPDWPEEWGGRGADRGSTRASLAVWQEVGYTPPPRSTTGLVGAAILKFGTPELKAEVLPRIASGEITAALGYTEPSGGSDVSAAKTRAVRDGDDWIINGQKMFTSGAEWASYVFLLTRTDPDVPKHKGLTMFLVPLDAPGVEIHPVHTFMDERTNAHLLHRRPHSRPLPHRRGQRRREGDGLGAVPGAERRLLPRSIRAMADAATDWARRNDKLEDPRILTRLARAYADAQIAEALSAKVLGMSLAGQPDLAFGPASKVFSTEAFVANSADLLDLAAPQSLIRGREGLGMVEMGYRHSTATSVYGGAGEVLRSMVAERRLGLPRSRA